MNPLNIGTSGWSHDHWSEPFSPDSLAAGDRLVYYAEQFSTLEINNSFYPSPAIEVVDHGRDAVPADFVFSAKASRRCASASARGWSSCAGLYNSATLRKVSAASGN